MVNINNKIRHIEPPDDWNREEQLDDGFNRLILYQVLIKDHTGSYGYVFHPDFMHYVDYVVNTIKASQRLKAHFQWVVKEYGDFGYITSILLPHYFAMQKVLKEITSGSSFDRVLSIIHKADDETFVLNWTEEQLEENNIMGQIVHTKLKEEGKNLSKLIESSE